MTETNIPDEPPLTAAAKLAAKRHNERQKFFVSILHSLAIAIFGLGGLRLIFDPSAQPPAMFAIALAIAIPVALEFVAYYILGNLEAES